MPSHRRTPRPRMDSTAGSPAADHTTTAMMNHTFKPSRRAGGVSLVFGEAGIVAHDQMAVDLLNKIERHANHDQQAGAAVEGGDAVIDFHRAVDQARDDGDDGK